MNSLDSATPSFKELGVVPTIADLLTATGITAPFPIQVATLPDAIAGRDILGCGQTGSGKTLAFGLAMLTRLAGRPALRRQPLALVLVPTRELAMQVTDALTPLGRKVGIDIRLVAGGMPYGKQIESLRRGVHILVATPGRLKDLIEKGEADLSQVSITILDEADQMADLGFTPIVREILDQTRPNSQRLLFSATLDGAVAGLVKKYLKNPAEHSVQASAVTTMEHHALLVHRLDKDVITAQIAARDGRTILFVRTQRGADRLAEKLAAQGIAVGSLHGGKRQAVRTRTLAAFRSGLTPVLVATDVAARGIHVDDISLVVHVDAPTDPKDYTHRAGRTARAGESGRVVTLVDPRHESQVVKLTKAAGVRPTFVRVRPGSVELNDVTGAREPSGIPWIAPAEKPVQVRSHRGGSHGRPRTHGRSHAPRTGSGNGSGARRHKPAARRAAVK